MHRLHRLLAGLLLATVLAGLAVAAQAQKLAPNYALTAPSMLAEPELPAGLPLASWGPLRVAAAHSANGSGLSFEAGEQWFARAGMGRSLDDQVLSLGGGYRFGGGESVSMHVTRQLGQERLGLAVRYDWRRSYLRLSYESPVRSLNVPDRLRFSAGVRF
jgi:opacity protein-like surface antigen